MRRRRATENLGAQLTSIDCQVAYVWTYLLHQLESDLTLDHGCSDGEVQCTSPNLPNAAGPGSF